MKMTCRPDSDVLENVSRTTNFAIIRPSLNYGSDSCCSKNTKNNEGTAFNGGRAEYLQYAGGTTHAMSISRLKTKRTIVSPLFHLAKKRNTQST